jgi:sugar/nucleoside kinase (ribokinase family)
MSVLIIGNATRDSIYYVPALPLDDEVAAASKKLCCLGGRGVVPALVTSSLGVDTHLCTVIGTDQRETFDRFLAAYGINARLVKWDDTAPGVTEYVAFASPTDGTTAAIALAPPLDWTCSKAQLAGVYEFPIVYFSTNKPAFNLQLLEHVNPDAQCVVHSLGIRFEEEPSYVEMLLRKASLLIGNRHEFSMLSAMTGAAIPELIAQGSVVRAIVTSGDQPLQIYERGGAEPALYSITGHDGRVVPIGAGDSFAAGLLCGLSEGQPLAQSIELAIRCGRLAAESPISYPDLAAVARLRA